MRGREFTMKDAYSFDRDEAGAQRSYDTMYAAYMRIFSRLGLEFRAVAADTGSIGGTRSHEFQVIAETGEDLLVYNSDSEYAANIELAEAPNLYPVRGEARQPMAEVATPAPPREDVAAARHPAGTDRQIHRPGHRRRQGPGPDLAADAARRPRAERDQGRQAARPGGLPLRHRKRDRRAFRLQARLSGRSAPPVASWPTARSPTWRISSAAPTRKTSTSRA